MVQVPDSPVRLYLRVSLKVATLAAFVAVALVLLQYMGFGGASDTSASTRISVAAIEADEGQRAGSHRGTVWILHRSEATRSELAGEDGAASIPRWFVVRDRGARTGCALLWHSGPREFRETCSDARYDAAGRPLGDTGGGDLDAPAFTFDESATSLIIGD